MAAEKELKDIQASIDELAKRGKITRNRALAAWYAITFYDLDEDEALEAAAADGGNDQGIDIAFADTSAEEIVVLQAFCPERTDKTTPKAKWDAVIASVPYVKNPALLSQGGRPDLTELLGGLRTKYPDYAVSIGLISLGIKSDAIVRSVHAHEKDGAHDTFSFFFSPQEEIKTKFQSLLEAEAGIPEDELRFAGNHFEDNGEYGRAWIGSVSAAELKRLHGVHGDKLFAGNCRASCQVGQNAWA